VHSRFGQRNRAANEHLIDKQIHQRGGMFRSHVDGADLSLCFSPDMPHLPGGAAFLHHRQDVIGRLCDPAGVDDPGGFGVRCQRLLDHRRDGATSA
jgi:hypothetical protein